MAVKTKATPTAKKDTTKPVAKVPNKKVEVVVPQKDKKTSTGKTIYHVSKRYNDGREWKVFIQTSDKVIKLFKTQEEALKYAKELAKNKDNATVMLHGLDGKIRKY